MASVEDILDQVDGLRRDTAKRVQARFASVGELASASTEQLTEINGVGAVMAERIHAVAADARSGGAAQTDPSRGRVGKAVGSATGAARNAADLASRPAKKVVDRVVKRGR